LKIFNFDAVFIDDLVSCFDVIDGSIIFELEWHDLHEGLLESNQLLDEVLLLLFDELTFELLKRINFFFQSQHKLLGLIEFLFGLVDQDNINLMLIERDLMLLEKLNHTLDFLDKDLDLRSEFLIVTNNLHYLSQ
jgi:hypothetical protein